MGRFMVCVLTAGLFTSVIVLAQDQKGPDDARQLQGVWQAVAIEANGEKQSIDQNDSLKVVFEGDQVYAVRPKGEDPRNTFKVNPAKSPKQIDLFPVDGPRKGQLVPGIYALENGKLKLCINIFGSDSGLRPARFKTQDHDGVAYAVLERATTK